MEGGTFLPKGSVIENTTVNLDVLGPLLLKRPPSNGNCQGRLPEKRCAGCYSEHLGFLITLRTESRRPSKAGRARPLGTSQTSNVSDRSLKATSHSAAEAPGAVLRGPKPLHHLGRGSKNCYLAERCLF